jgi:phosphoserine phosphatase
MLRSLDASGLIAELEQLGPPGLVACDADGTLWQGDVGEDVFVAALRSGFLKTELEGALREEAAAAALSTVGNTSELCLTLYKAYRAGRFDERRVCEVMTWCYAGHTPEAVADFAKDQLHSVAAGNLPLAGRYNPALQLVVDWARQQGCRCVIVSASPRWILEQAAAPLGFGPEDIVGAQALVRAGVIQASMDGAVPYGPDKQRLGAPLAGDGPWLASFGDSQFDIDLLRAARLAVGVQPKPALKAALERLDAACELI